MAHITHEFLVNPEAKPRERDISHNPHFYIAYLTCTMREKVWDKSEIVCDMSLFIPTLSDQSNQLG